MPSKLDNEKGEITQHDDDTTVRSPPLPTTTAAATTTTTAAQAPSSATITTIPKRNNTTSNNNNSIFVKPEYTRLVTIVAHVDHGKTTLADNLIEYNGIISERLAGTIRYLDSNPEEQRRGITMKSSAIALKHKYYPPPGGSTHNNMSVAATLYHDTNQIVGETETRTPNIISNNNNKSKNSSTGISSNNNRINDKNQQSNTVKNDTMTQQQQDDGIDMIIHILDSPGHTDFSYEVSTSVLACDNGLIVIDCVEGMGSRSHQIIRETYKNQLIPILVINKIDKLITELGCTPIEAYIRIQHLIEIVNAAASTIIISARAILNADTDSNTQTKTNDTVNEKRIQERYQLEEKIWTFDPIIGNVIFCSAYHGWGFIISSLTRSLYRNNTIPIKPMKLKQFMFGDYKLSSTDNTKIVKWKQQTHYDENNIPLFAKYGLQPLWSIYEGISIAANAVGLSKTQFAESSTTSTDNNNNNNNKSRSTNKSQDTKIRADTIGMDQVLQSIQIGATTTTSTTAGMVVIKSNDELQTTLTKTGSGNSEESVLRCILRRYRPLADCVLNTICEYCPSPKTATSYIRTETLTLQSYPLHSSPRIGTPNDEGNNSNEENDDLIKMKLNEYHRICQGVKECSTSEGSATVAHICKFLSTDMLHIRDVGLSAIIQNTSDTGIDNNNNNRNNSIILGVARVLCGTLRTGYEYYLMGPNYKALESQIYKRKIRLYLLMGSSFIHVDEVPAGHLCGIYYDLREVEYFKSVTLCDRPNGMPLRGIENPLRPLVKVNIEPEDSADMNILEQGLAKLVLADASIEVTSTGNGEKMLACLGELHLEQSILDLEKTYCNKDIKLRISDPIVDFAETTTWFNEQEYTDYYTFWNDDKSIPIQRQSTIPPYNEEEGIQYAKHGRARSILSGRCAAITVRVIPLAQSVYKILKSNDNIVVDDEEATTELQKVGNALHFIHDSPKNNPQSILDNIRRSIISFDSDGGNVIIESSGVINGSMICGIQSNEIYVPSSSDHQNAINNNTKKIDEGSVNDVLINKVEYDSLLSRLKDYNSSFIQDNDNDEISLAAKNIWKSDMRGSVVAGFQLAVRAGPICEEPVRNILIVIESVEIALIKNEEMNIYKPSKTLSGGMVVSSLRSGIRCALLSRPVRLMEGHLRLTLHSSLSGLGPLYNVLSKRRGKVLDDSMVDGTDLLLISASIPQVEAFGLAPELFGKTSGEVTAPEMIFSHWECLDVDPFWIPTSEEEREDFGELQIAGDSSTGLDNNALSYIRMVRTRKGLLVDSNRTVISAEKQRTLKR